MAKGKQHQKQKKESGAAGQPRRSPSRETVFQSEFIEDLQYWVEADRRTAMRVLELVEAIRRDPFSGVGKPEPLKYFASGAWSRRITQEHRIVYMVQETRINFLQCRYHY